MTNAKTEEPDVKAIELKRFSLVGSSWTGYTLRQDNGGNLTNYNEAAALISQLTADRDAFERDLKHVRSMAGKSRGELEATLEAAEKRVKELEEGRDLDKVVLDEGIEIINELEASNKLLSERVAVLEGGLTRLASPEAFDVPRMANKEEQARMLYADDVLRRARKLEGK